MLMSNKTLLTFQMEHAGPSQSGWMFENNKAQAVAAGVGEAISTCSLRVQLQGSCACRVSDKVPFGSNLEDTCAGFAELPKECKEFMKLFFGNPIYKSGCRSANGVGGATRSTGGATFANLSMGQAKDRRTTSVSLHDSAEMVAATLRMTVGVVIHDTQEATAVTPPEQIAAPANENRTIKDLMDLIKYNSSPEVQYIKENTVTIGGNVLAFAVRYHDGKDDDMGTAVSLVDVIRNADVIEDKEVITAKLAGREIGYRVESKFLGFLIRIKVIVVRKVSKGKIGLKAAYANPNLTDVGYTLEYEEPADLESEGEAYEFPFPLQKEADEKVDGWNAKVTIDDIMHTVKLRFFLDGQTYTAEAEDVPVAVTLEGFLKPEAVALLPVTKYTAPEPVHVSALAPEQTIMTWMAEMGHADLASAAGAVQKYGFTDLADVKRASVADIDDMLGDVTLGWTRLHQGRFKRKWEEMQI
jgi:hypothetical protein